MKCCGMRDANLRAPFSSSEIGAKVTPAAGGKAMSYGWSQPAGGCSIWPFS
jgi:hypothetical protein